jgi:hypothetical protein
MCRSWRRSIVADSRTARAIVVSVRFVMHTAVPPGRIAVVSPGFSALGRHERVRTSVPAGYEFESLNGVIQINFSQYGGTACVSPSMGVV